MCVCVNADSKTKLQPTKNSDDRAPVLQDVLVFGGVARLSPSSPSPADFTGFIPQSGDLTTKIRLGAALGVEVYRYAVKSLEVPWTEPLALGKLWPLILAPVGNMPKQESPKTQGHLVSK